VFRIKYSQTNDFSFINAEEGFMEIQVNTDKNINADARLIEVVEKAVKHALKRFGNQVTRVEVHLSDENSKKKSAVNDKRCLLEARIAGLKPISVSETADTVQLALDGAADKLQRSIESTLGKLAQR
jgi:ribosomal subunit interface protein